MKMYQAMQKKNKERADKQKESDKNVCAFTKNSAWHLWGEQQKEEVHAGIF